MLLGCSEDDNKPYDDGYDRSSLLENYADNIIIPSFESLGSRLEELKATSTEFSATTNQDNLNNLSLQWIEAYKAWQHVQMYNLGKPDDLSGTSERGFVVFFNLYPVNTSEINNAAANGNYDLTNSNYYDSQGFPALDYLLHGVVEGDISALDKFTTNANAEGYKAYLNDVINRMESLISQIVDDWKNSYRDIFIVNLDRGLNGSFNMLANDFVYSYEKDFRADKVGIPAGNFSPTPLPEKVEAYYKSDINKVLTLEALTAIERAFEGKAFNGNSTGPSLKTYLEFLDREDLVTEITNQFEAVRVAVNELDDNFSQQVISNNTAMTITYDVMQAAVPLLKVDMKQALNFAIDYTDSDGD